MSSHEDLEYAQKIYASIQQVSSDTSRQVRMIAASLAEARRRGRKESLEQHQPCNVCGRRWYIDYDGMWTLDHKNTCSRVNALGTQLVKDILRA